MTQFRPRLLLPLSRSVLELVWHARQLQERHKALVATEIRIDIAGPVMWVRCLRAAIAWCGHVRWNLPLPLSLHHSAGP